jgi:uncharacterized protein (TIRG00374 family)
MKKLRNRILLGVAGGVLVYVAFSIWADARAVGAALRGFAWSALGIALLLAAANYALRALRWEMYLRVLGLRVPWRDSLLVFLAGFSLTVTPGKLGEVLKSFLLREAHAVPAARTAPIVVAERVTDLVGLLALTAAGAFTFDVDRRFLVAAAALVTGGLAVISVEPLALAFVRAAARLPGLRSRGPKLEEFYRSAAALLRPGPLLAAVVLSTLSWWFECVAFWVIVRGFAGASIELPPATFTYAAMTIAGALSFLPGGLGITEGGMLALLTRFGTGTDTAVATAATFITRLCTLWFAVLIGLGALVVFSRRTRVAVGLPSRATPTSNH